MHGINVAVRFDNGQFFQNAVRPPWRGTRCWQIERRSLPVNLPAVADFDDQNRQRLIFQPADQTVIAHAVADHAFQFARQHLAQQARVRRREQPCGEEAENPLLRRSIQVLQLLPRFDEKTHLPGQGIRRPPREKILVVLPTPSRPERLPRNLLCLQERREQPDGLTQLWIFPLARRNAPEAIQFRSPTATQPWNQPSRESSIQRIRLPSSRGRARCGLSFPPNAVRPSRRGTRCWSVRRREIGCNSRGRRRSGCISRARSRARRLRPA